MDKISKKTFEGDFYDFLEYLEEKSFESIFCQKSE